MKTSLNFLEQFYEVGYFVLEGVFSLDEVAEMSKAMDRLQQMAAGLEGKVMRQGSQLVVEKGALKRVVWAGAAEPGLLEYGRGAVLTGMVAQILGSKSANHLINQVHFKLPHDGVFYPWHQDSYHRGYCTPNWTDLTGRGSFVQTVTAIDESILDNGPLLFIPGSCRRGDLHLPYDEHTQTVSPKFNPTDAIPLLMKPGDVVFFGPYTIHGSLANNSDKPRRAFINGYAYPGANKKVYSGDGAGELVKLI